MSIFCVGRKLPRVAAAFSIAMALVCSTVSAQAQDWTGPYLGGHVGWSFGENDGVSTDHGPGVAAGTVYGFSHKMNGFAGGFYGGYNYKLSEGILVGVEGDVTFLNADGKRSDSASGTVGFIPFTTNGSLGAKQTFGTSIRGRLGFLAADNVLLYGTGGVAFGKFENDHYLTVTAAGVTSSFSDSDTKMLTGFVVGGGGEMKVGSNILLRLEYLYTDFGGNDFATILQNDVFTNDLDLSSHTVRVGAAYKF